MAKHRIELLLEEAETAAALFGRQRRADEIAVCHRELALKECFLREMQGEERRNNSNTMATSAGSKRSVEEMSESSSAQIDRLDLAGSSNKKQQWLTVVEDEVMALRRRKRDLVADVELYDNGLLGQLKEKGKSIWKKLPWNVRWKKEVLLAVFLSGKIPPEMEDENWKTYTPTKRIRDDRDLLLVRVMRKTYADPPAHITIPKSLWRDGEVIAAALHRYPEWLESDSFPKLVLDRVVYNTYSWDLPAVRQLKILLKDKEFMVRVLRIWPWKQAEPKWYKLLSNELKEDLEIVRAGFDGDCISIYDLPPKLMYRQSFWVDLIRLSPRLWYYLPEEFMEDPAFVVGFHNNQMIDDVFSKMRFLGNDPAIWKYIIKDGTTENDEDMVFWLRQRAPESIWSNYELMLAACRRSGKVLEFLPFELLRNRSILIAALGARPQSAVLKYIPKEIQVFFPDLTAKAILSLQCEHTFVNVVGDLEASWVAKSLWADLRICEAWLRVARGRLHEHFPASLKTNPKFGLMVFEHGGDLKKATSAKLRSDSTFIQKAVEVHNSAFLCAEGNARCNFDVVISAFSKPRDTAVLLKEIAESPVEEVVKDVAILRAVREIAVSQVEAYDGFNQGFLHGMTAFGGPNCQLRVLVTDESTTLGLKKWIASFLELPLYKDVGKLRRAIDNLSYLPDLPEVQHPQESVVEWSDDDSVDVDERYDDEVFSSDEEET